jgi:hypothetical protein
MPQILAWECPRTKKLFTSEAKYRNHLRKLARDSLVAKRRQKIVDSRLEIFKTMRETCKNAEEIEQFVKDNVKVFWAHGLHQSAFHKNDEIPEDLVCHSYKITATHRDSVSNSHHCPMSGGVTNWGGEKKDAPKGYPGFQGRVEFKFSHDTPGFSSDMWKNTGLETGSGGGGSKGGGYEIFMFDADWPAWQEDHDKKLAEWQERMQQAKAKYDAEYPAKKEAWEKDVMERILRGELQSAPKYEDQWNTKFSFPTFSYPKFEIKV